MSLIGIDERIGNLPGVSWYLPSDVYDRNDGERLVETKFVMEDGGFYTLDLLYNSVADIYPIDQHIMVTCSVDCYYKVERCVNIVKSLMGRDYELLDVTSYIKNTVVMIFVGVEKMAHEFSIPESNGKFIVEKVNCFINELNEKAQKLIDQYNRDGDQLVYVNPTMFYGDLVAVELGFESIPGSFKENRQGVIFTIECDGREVPLEEGYIKENHGSYKMNVAIVDYVKATC